MELVGSSSELLASFLDKKSWSSNCFSFQNEASCLCVGGANSEDLCCPASISFMIKGISFNLLDTCDCFILNNNTYSNLCTD